MLASGGLDLNPGPATYMLWDLGRGADPLWASVLFLSEKDDGTHFTELLCIFSERSLYVKDHLALPDAW